MLLRILYSFLILLLSTTVFVTVMSIARKNVQSGRSTRYRYKVSSISSLIREDDSGNKHEQCVNQMPEYMMLDFYQPIDNITEVIITTRSDDIANEGYKKTSAFAFFENDQVKKLKVEPGTSQWQLDLFRAIFGSFQIPSRVFEKRNQHNREFRIMEDSISGNCSMHYLVTGANNNLKIVKTKDYSKCSKLSLFHRGFFGKRGLNSLLKENKIISRKSTSTIIIKKYVDGTNYVDSVELISEIAFSMKNYSLKAVSSLNLKYGVRVTENHQKKSFDDPELISVPGLSFDTEVDLPRKSHLYSNLKFKDLAHNELYTKHPYSTSIVIGLTRRIAKDLALTEKNHDVDVTKTLQAFTNLVEVIKNMNFESLAKSGRVIIKDKWELFVFKRALAAAGTFEALPIMTWFFKKKLWLSDDADLILDIPSSCETLDLNYLSSFFSDIVKPSRNIDRFEDNAIIAFSRLLGKYQTENTPPLEQDLFRRRLLDEYIPYIQERIGHTYGKDKFQIYTRALGNIGDGDILKMYVNETYHSRDFFQQMLTLNSMDKIMGTNPKQAQEILLGLWNETVSIHRLVIINKLLETYLDSDTLLKIYNESWNDWKNQFSSSDLKGAYNWIKKKSTMLKEFGYSLNSEIPNPTELSELDEYCGMLLCTGYGNVYYKHQGDRDDVYSFVLETFRSETEFPSFMSLNIKKSRHGFEKEHKINGLLNHLRDFTRMSSCSTLSTGNIMLDYGWNQYFYPFQNETLTIIYQRFAEQFNKEESFMVKTLSLDTSSFSIPMENGFQFEMSYNEPLYLHLNITKRISDDSLDFHILRSKVEQLNVKILNPFDETQCIYKNDYQVHINVPLSVSLTSNETFAIKPLFTEGKQTILHFSNRPYLVEEDLHPIIALNDEDKVSESVTYDNISEANGFQFLELNGFYIESKDFDMHSFVLDEILNFKFGGPFRYYPSSHFVFNLKFENDLKVPTALIFANKVINRENPSKMIESACDDIIRPITTLYRAGEYHANALFTGETNQSFSLTIKELQEIEKSVATKELGGKILYKKNNETQVEILLGFDSKVSDCEQNKYVNFVIDFENVELRLTSGLCALKGDNHSLSNLPDDTINATEIVKSESQSKIESDVNN